MPTSNASTVPVKIVGGNDFGIYPKISIEKSYNTFISDGYMVNYAGYTRRTSPLAGVGRGVFNSIRGGFMVAVIGTSVYRINSDLTRSLVGTLGTTTTEVYMDENLSGQIGIVDQQDMYIYNYDSGLFQKQTLPFTPGYICYHNASFLIASAKSSVNPQFWYVYTYDTPTTVQQVADLRISTKPDKSLAVVRIPGGGNNVLVLGSIVGETWTLVGGTEYYRRVSSSNFNNGVVNPSTIGSGDYSVFFLGQNETGARSIFEANSQSIQAISTDGIDKVLETVRYPENSTGFCYRQDGHLFYQLTFFDEADNFTLFYDTKTKNFFYATDESLNYYPARQVAYFNNTTYFVSLNDGALYEMGDEFVDYNYTLNPNSDGLDIPRLRYTNKIAHKTGKPYRMGDLVLTIEQGVNDYVSTDTDNLPAIDMAMSKNGGQSFGNFTRKYLNLSGDYRNVLRWRQLGMSNETVFLFRFIGLQRLCVSDATLEVY